MKLLLDTHLVVWAAEGIGRLPSAARKLMSSTESELVFSVVSLWEIAIKHGLGRTDFQVDVRVLRRNLVENGYIELPILGEHVLAVDSLPAIHKDPFDRLLVAQATVEGITLLTADKTVGRYPGPVRQV